MIYLSHFIHDWFLVISFALLLLLSPVAECKSKRSHDTESSSNNVSQRNRNEILHKHLLDCDVSSTEDTKRDHEHIGNTKKGTLNEKMKKEVSQF